MTSDHTISAIGFCTPTGDGNFSTLEGAIRNIVELGSEAVELSLYGEEIISGGRLIPHRVDRLIDITRQFDMRYSVHGQIVSNFMDREHLDYQKAVVRAMLELCDRVGAEVLVHHSGHAPMPALSRIPDLDKMERDALAEMAELAKTYGVRIALENIFNELSDDCFAIVTSLKTVMKTTQKVLFSQKSVLIDKLLYLIFDK